MTKKRAILPILIIFLLAIFAVGAYAAPIGVSVSVIGTETQPSGIAADSHAAFGGNITNLNINGNSQTLVWQGYFGDVAGNLVLEDASGDILYDWTGGATTGEVYSSTSNAVAWASIVAQNDCSVGNSITGTNADAMNNTFTASSNSAITVGSTVINASTACSVYTFVNSANQSSIFQEVVLTDGTNTIYSTFIENNAVGFDGGNYDFQMIVPEDNDGTTTTYYFYMELG